MPHQLKPLIIEVLRGQQRKYRVFVGAAFAVGWMVPPPAFAEAAVEWVRIAFAF